MDSKKFYITTTLPYVNAEPHIGFALEIVQADCLARLRRDQGHNVVFNFGTDEHGLKIYRKALENKTDPQAYVDEYAAKFDDLKKALNLSYTNFIRTTDPEHKKAAQEFWKLCDKNGYIYKKLYKIKYCVGCELEKTDSELVDGKCPLHPNQKIEVIDEENYFFKFSEFQKPLLELYKSHKDFVVPDFRFNEIKRFVEEGLQDFSISRLKEKLPWGVPVPGDDDHVMYVWFDALINYISTLGWPNDSQNFKNFWPGVQFAGKDNLRQQSAIWQAMLLAADLPNTKQIVIHGFITIGGQKISKSLGNVVSPYDLVEKYGIDATRYYLLAKVHPFEDSDFTLEKFETAYNADLANGLGNTVSRVAKLAENSKFDFEETILPEKLYCEEFTEALNAYRFDLGINNLWLDLSIINHHLDSEKPWLIEDKYKLEKILQEDIDNLRIFAHRLKPFLPETAETILKQFKGPKITSGKPLFPRIQ